MKLLTTLALSLLSTHAWAHHCSLWTDREVVSQTTTYTSSACTMATPLKLVRTTGTYYAFGTLTVDAWQGSFTRPTQSTETVRYTTYRCDASIVRSWTATEVTDGLETFEIQNPNLDYHVKTSFEANAPMTDDEALEAMRETENACLAGKVTP